LLHPKKHGLAPSLSKAVLLLTLCFKTRYIQIPQVLKGIPEIAKPEVADAKKEPIVDTVKAETPVDSTVVDFEVFHIDKFVVFRNSFIG
jgi:hypothetical protein